jgi:hypothetical protein
MAPNITDFLPFLLENSVAAAAKNVIFLREVGYVLTSILKKKLSKSVEQKLRYKRFRIRNATVQYERNSPILRTR